MVSSCLCRHQTLSCFFFLAAFFHHMRFVPCENLQLTFVFTVELLFFQSFINTHIHHLLFSFSLVLLFSSPGLTVDFVEFEVTRALEWLQSDRFENRRLAAVLVRGFSRGFLFSSLARQFLLLFFSVLFFSVLFFFLFLIYFSTMLGSWY